YDDDDDEEDDGPINPRLDKAITIMGVAAAVVIIGIFIYLIATVVFDLHFFNPDAIIAPVADVTETDDGKDGEESDQVSVPNLLGMTADEAKAALSGKGLGYKAVATESSNQYAEGQITKQSPSANESVDRNTTIKVTLSSGKGELEIPDVKGQIESTAESLITDAGFKCVKEYSYSKDVEQGQVISQTPGGGSLGKEGDTITITISQGEEAAKVPNVIGKDMDEAVEELEEAGFFVKAETSYSSTVAAGCVISQSVAGGEEQPMGTTIKLVISGGAEVTYYTFSITVEPHENLETVYTLKDASGTTIESWNISSPTTISMKNLTSPSGTLYYDNTTAGGNSTGSQNITFNKQ
ncbi:MAG: PASTA domain-containing protein, partial [Lachnospiraceae bacterium]|nr:PASTA domain-containing protein [Lachnospiraceae bacterium]